ncbi:flagellar biosynthetic protein FliQ [Acidobacteria bacterium AB60]|nr:flagellar biosynthetic protein FliQ [Acidobacteria bacterium AB60]
METDQAVMLGKMMLQEVLVLSAPILAVAVCISLVVNIVQVLTSLQDATISSIPRLLGAGAALFFFMPWMWRHLAHYTFHILSNFNPYLQ